MSNMIRLLFIGAFGLWAWAQNAPKTAPQKESAPATPQVTSPKPAAEPAKPPQTKPVPGQAPN